MFGVRNLRKGLVLCVLLCHCAVYGQYDFSNTLTNDSSTIEVKGSGSYRKAQKLLFKENYIVALPYLQKAIALQKAQGKNTDRLLFQLGMCYTVSKSPARGLSIIDSLEKTNPSVHPDLPYWKAVAHHYNYQFEQAIVYYKKALFLNAIRGAEKEEIKKKIKECENGMQLMQSLGDFEVVNAGKDVNTIYSEHSPTLESNSRTLYYTSRKNIDGEHATFTGEYFEDIYKTHLDSNTWARPQSVKEFNSKEHDASSQITNGDKTMVMYRSTHNGDIYISNKEKDNWSNPTVVKGLNTMSYESSAFLTQDGKRLYFSSNKFSDQGDLDLYYMDMTTEGSWGRPKTLGRQINTEYNEDGIFITDDGSTMYFSSQGHNTMGGYDIFKSTWDGNKWSKPENLGYPINSPGDDAYYILSPNKKFAIFSSYREGVQGMRDLYLCIPTDKVLADIKIMDSLTQQQVDAALTIKIKNTQSGLELSEIANGLFEKQIDNRHDYVISVFKDSNLIHTDTMHVQRTVKSGLTLHKTLWVAYHKQAPKLALKDTLATDTAFVYESIYFAHNHSKITKEYFPILNELIKTLKENKDVSIEIQGYADDGGDVEYNKSLSELRAHNVYDFLTSRGISRKRVHYKGFGRLPNTGSKENRKVRIVKLK